MPDTYYPDKKEPEIKIHPMGETVLVDVVDQPRTYKVTRRQMKEIFNSCVGSVANRIKQMMLEHFDFFESEAVFPHEHIKEIAEAFEGSSAFELLKTTFPEYFYIPEGEPVLVREDEGDNWIISISDGKGGVYINGHISPLAQSQTWKQIIPFTKNPPK